MTADRAYQTILYIVNKYQAGEPSPAEYTTIIQYGQNMEQAALIGLIEQQPQGRPIPRIGLGNNDKIYQSLSPFIFPLNISVNSFGVAIKPTDFQAWVNMSTTDGKDIRFVQKDSWNNWKGSVIDPVTTNPIYTIDANGFLFAPSTIGSCVLTYIQTPPESIWAYTLGVDGATPIYDAANSVGLKWRDMDCYKVIAQGLKIVGINLSSAAVEQYANSVIQSGE